ncbi:MAG: D-alanyl-D-alanine carboxypeptidase [Lactobacillales bacterium]|nr:D-alanyl-D-alanine carboxypeptidase [Lactobacillales bacterium]
MKKFVGMFLILLFVFPSIVLASDTISVNKEVADIAGNAKSAILIEATTGKIIFEKNSHEKLAPASMTKIMSMLLIMENIDKGVISWDDTVTTSENASSMGGSQILLETGEQMSVYDMFKGIAVASGNDAVVALAEYIAGSEEEFVNMMNKKAKELGLKDTVFKNPHGLDTANHYSSAYDMAFIAKELVKYEKVFEFTSIYEDYLRKGTDRELWLVNTNKLVRFNPIVDGLKTGFTSEAGYCLTATAKKNNMRLISVVMGEPDTKTRNSETTSLLDYGFAKYKAENIVTKDTVIDKLKIEKASNKSVDITPINDYSVILEKTDKIGKITYDLKLKNIKLPIKKGDKIGTLIIKEDNKKISEVDVTVKQNLKKANMLELYGTYLKSILNGNINF